MNNKNLVIIAAGKNSLHQQWIEDYTKYGFDLCLLKYGDYEFTDENSKNATYQLTSSGMKFKLVTNFYNLIPEALNYEYTMMMDDDLEISPKDIELFFGINKKYNFDLSQPALTVDSYKTYPGTIRLKHSIYHKTNVVEVMAPCFSKRLLEITLEDLKASKYGFGWGLEIVWDKKYNVGFGNSIFGGQIGVIDATLMRHTRPVGGRTNFSKATEEHNIQTERVAHLPTNATNGRDNDIITYDIRFKDEWFDTPSCTYLRVPS
jgi:hypothetical protein